MKRKPGKYGENMNESNQKNIVFITDENYAMPTGIAIMSLISHISDEDRYQIYIVASEVSDVTKRKLLSLSTATVRIAIKDESLNALLVANTDIYGNNQTHVTKTALLKFDLPRIFFNLDNILYLDSDILINDDISPIYQMDLSECYIAAADDMGDYKTENGFSYLGCRIGLQSDHYFNSGVMMLNLEKMRKDNITEKLWTYRSEFKNYFVDQDALNVVLQEKRNYLGIEYNFRTSVFQTVPFKEICARYFSGEKQDINECLSNIKIFHMTDRYKPWLYKIDFFSNLFEYYYKSSPFFDKALTLKSYTVAINEEYQQLYERYKALDNAHKNLTVAYGEIRGKYDTLDNAHKNLTVAYSEIREKYDTWLPLYKRLKKIHTDLNLAHTHLINAHVDLAKKYEYLKDCKKMMDWRFPAEKMEKSSKIVLYGAGEVGKVVMKQIQSAANYWLALWVDTNFERYGNEIVSPDLISETEYDYVLIAVSRREVAKQITFYLKNRCVPEKKICYMKDWKGLQKDEDVYGALYDNVRVALNRKNKNLSVTRNAFLSSIKAGAPCGSVAKLRELGDDDFLAAVYLTFLLRNPEGDAHRNIPRQSSDNTICREKLINKIGNSNEMVKKGTYFQENIYRIDV